MQKTQHWRLAFPSGIHDGNVGALGEHLVAAGKVPGVTPIQQFGPLDHLDFHIQYNGVDFGVEVKTNNRNGADPYRFRMTIGHTGTIPLAELKQRKTMMADQKGLTPGTLGLTIDFERLTFDAFLLQGEIRSFLASQRTMIAKDVPFENAVNAVPRNPGFNMQQRIPKWLMRPEDQPVVPNNQGMGFEETMQQMFGSWKLSVPISDEGYHQYKDEILPNYDFPEAHDPEHWYHDVGGYNLHRLPDILNQGLIPWNQLQHGTNYKGLLRPRTDHVYLQNRKVWHPEEYATVEPQPPQIRVRHDKLDPQKINLDEDYLFKMGPMNLVRKGPNVEQHSEFDPRLRNSLGIKEDSTNNQGQWMDDNAEQLDLDKEEVILDHLRNPSRDWEAGTIAYNGIIPPEHLEFNPEWLRWLETTDEGHYTLEELEAEHPKEARKLKRLIQSQLYAKTAGQQWGWQNYVMPKAKRLKDSGAVQLEHNGYNYVDGTVQGDHGVYHTEIWREDPNSQAITAWRCGCPWFQYAFGRTRRWKKLEGRPCSHVMALFWTGMSTPLDQDASAPPDTLAVPAPADQPQPTEQQAEEMVQEPTVEAPGQAPNYEEKPQETPGLPDQLQLFDPTNPNNTGIQRMTKTIRDALNVLRISTDSANSSHGTNHHSNWSYSGNVNWSKQESKFERGTGKSA